MYILLIGKLFDNTQRDRSLPPVTSHGPRCHKYVKADSKLNYTYTNGYRKMALILTCGKRIVGTGCLFYVDILDTVSSLVSYFSLRADPLNRLYGFNVQCSYKTIDAKRKAGLKKKKITDRQDPTDDYVIIAQIAIEAEARPKTPSDYE